MRLDPARPPAQIIQKAVQVIRQGGVVLYPSDTVYGLGCDPYQPKAVERLCRLKGRAGDKGFLLLVGDLDCLESICENVPEVFYDLRNAFWPGPVTFLLAGKRELSPSILGREGKVGVRCPDQLFLQRWMKSVPGPIVSTSANRSGEPLPRTLSQLRRLFQDRVDLFLEAGPENPPVLPSTVIDLTLHPPVMTRAGQQARRVREFLVRISRTGS